MVSASTLVLSASLASGAGASVPSWTPSATPFALAASSDDGASSTERTEMERQMVLARRSYKIGSVGLKVGLGGLGVGVVLVGAGLPGALCCGQEVVAGLGLATGLAGAATVGLSTPMFMIASRKGAGTFETQHISVRRAPGWVFLGGAAVLGTAWGAAAVIGSYPGVGAGLLVGGAATVGGAAAQIVDTRRAFRQYDAKTGSGAQARLVPHYARDTFGLNLVVSI